MTTNAQRPEDAIATTSTSAQPVVLFLPTLATGGSERMTVHLAQAMRSLGIPVQIVLGCASRLDVPPFGEGIDVIGLEKRHVRNCVVPLARHLRHWRPVGVISRMRHANTVAAAAHWLSGTKTPLVVTEATCWSSLHRELPPAARTFDSLATAPAARWLYSRADAIVAVSRGVAEDIGRFAPRLADRVHVIENPVLSDERLRQADQLADHLWLRDPRTCPVIVSVGSLRAAKDHATLLRAFARLRERRPARLILFGDGPLRETLRHLCDELAIQPDVDMPGKTDIPLAQMRAADLFVLSSQREGSPNVLVEALASGCRVVATDCPSGPAEILQGGKLGALVPVGDPMALADAMHDLLDQSPPRVEELQRLRQRYDHRRAAVAYLRLLRHPAASVDDGFASTAKSPTIQAA